MAMLLPQHPGRLIIGRQMHGKALPGKHAAQRFGYADVVAGEQDRGIGGLNLKFPEKICLSRAHGPACSSLIWNRSREKLDSPRLSLDAGEKAHPFPNTETVSSR